MPAIKFALGVVVSCLIIALPHAQAASLKICKTTDGRLLVKSKCSAKKGETLLDVTAMVGPTGQTGPQGSAGPAGATGSSGAQGAAGQTGPAGTAGPSGATGPTGPSGVLGVYGDGSAGAALMLFSGTLEVGNNQYTDFTVSNGVTITVPSGTVIRCTGSFSNFGQIVVSPWAEGGYIKTPPSFDFANVLASAGSPHPGVGRGLPRTPEVRPYDDSGEVVGGLGGQGIGDSNVAKNLPRRGPIGGGGGAGAPGATGGEGGGAIYIISQNDLTNAAGAVISANGEDNSGVGGGAGAGGVVLLASGTRVINEGTIEALGGDGGPGDFYAANGGGGGGGIVHRIAPAFGGVGAINVDGGNAGDDTTQITLSFPRYAGAGGGACGGNGGSGGSLPSGAPVWATGATAGSSGISVFTTADPPGLLF